MLPPEVMQAYGLQLPPVDASLPGAPAPDFGGLHPAVAQAYGLAQLPTPQPPPQPAPPPDPSPQELPPPARTLPSMQQAQPESASPAPSKDYTIPQSAFGGQQPTSAKPTPQRPVKPPSADQQAVEARQKEQAAEQQQARAIEAQRQVATQQAQEDLGAYQQHSDAAKRIQEERKAWNDEYAKTHAQKQAVVDSTLRAVDDYKIDRNRYWHDLGMGHKIGWGIAMAMSALGQAMQGQGGANPVIQMLQNEMHQAVDAQMDERDQLKAKNARAEHALDRYDAFSKDRNAQLLLADSENDKALANQIALTAAKMKDPAAQAEAQKQYGILMQSSADKATQAAEHAAQREMQGKQLAISGGQLAEQIRHNKIEEGWQQKKFDEEQQNKIALALAKSQGKLTADEEKFAATAPVEGSNGKATVLRNADGSVWKAGGGHEASATKIKDMMAGALTYNTVVNSMIRGIREHGGESDYIKSADWQRMMVNLKAATAELHDAYGIQAFREPTVKFFDEMVTGGVNPTSFLRDASAALVQSKENLEDKINDRLTVNNYTGPRVKFLDTSKETAPLVTDEDKAFKVAAGTRGDDPGAVYDPAAGRYQPKIAGAYRVDPDVSTVPAPNAKDTEVAKLYPNMGPGQRALLETWGAALRGTDPAMRDRAAAVLGKLADTAEEQGVRDYAARLLQDNVTMGAQPTFTEQTTTASGRTAGGRTPYVPPMAVPPQLMPQEQASRRSAR